MNFICRTDIDNINEAEVKRYMKLIIKLGKRRIEKVRYRLSSSGRGFHIELTYFIPKAVYESIRDPEAFRLGVRYGILDCYGRQKADISRLIINQKTDQLAEYKNGVYAREWKDFYTMEDIQ
jgi:hypothetical protein